MREKTLGLLEEIVENQRKKLFKIGSDIVPRLTDEDILQPMDYPELEYNPRFRYEEGMLDGLQTALTALYALYKDEKENGC